MCVYIHKYIHIYIYIYSWGCIDRVSTMFGNSVACLFIC